MSRASSRSSPPPMGPAAARTSATRSRPRSLGSRRATPAAPSKADARAAPSARSAMRHRFRSRPRPPDDRAQHDRVPKQHHRAIAEQDAVKLTPASPAHVKRHQHQRREQTGGDQHAHCDHRPAMVRRRRRRPGRRLATVVIARPCAQSKPACWSNSSASVPVPICAGVIGFGRYALTGGSAGFGATRPRAGTRSSCCRQVRAVRPRS